MKRFVILLVFLGLWVACSKDQEGASSSAPQETESAPVEAVMEEAVEAVTPETVKLVDGQEIEPIDLGRLLISTPGRRLSTDAHIVLDFSDDVVPNYRVGSILSENPFSFSPKIEGVARWTNRRELHFIPDNNLEPGVPYAGILDGRKLVGETQSVEKIKFDFTTAEQEVMSFDGEFISEDDGDNMVSYQGTLRFAQTVDLERLKKDLSCQSRGRNLDVEIEQFGVPNQVMITTAKIPRDREGRTFDFSLPKRYSATGDKWKSTAYLAALEVFKVITRMEGDVGDNGDLSFIFRFSDRIKPDTDLSGFVSVSPSLDFKVRVKRKSLTVEGQFEAGRQYTITLKNGLPSAFEPKLDEDYQATVRFNNIKPSIEWLSEGIYLPPDNNYRLQFKSINVKRARLKIFRVHAQNLGFFVQKNALKDLDPDDGDYYYAASYEDKDRVGEVIYDELIDITDDRNDWIKTELDMTHIFEGQNNAVFLVDLKFAKKDLVAEASNSMDQLGQNYLYYASESYYDNPAQDGYYYQKGNLSKLLISTNVGLMLKHSESGYDLLAIDLIKAEPLSGLKLKMVNYQNRVLESGTTDGNGLIHFKEKGHYIYGETSEGIAILRLDHPGWELSSFDVGGRNQRSGGTDVFSYTDRGVHRPGDMIHLSAIVRIKNELPPATLPIKLEVHNTLDQVVHRTSLAAGPNGLVHFPIQTNGSDPTGAWRAIITVGSQEFTHPLKVEMVKPVRLKTDIEVDTEMRHPRNYLKAKVVSRYLFGAPAANLKMEATATIIPQKLEVKGFDGYVFDNPITSFDVRDLDVFSGRLDSNGVAHISHRLPDLNKASSVLDVITRTKVFEKGGNFQESSAFTRVHPFPHYAGFKNVFKGRSVKRNESHKIPIVVVDPDGNRIPNQAIRVRTYVNRHYWWWHYNRNDRQDFRHRTGTYLVSEKNYTSIDGVIEHTLSVEDWGRHYFEVTDMTSGHSAGFYFYASSWGSRGSGDASDFENHLAITLNRDVYQPGDEIEVGFESASKGMAILTVEQGDRILSRQWKKLEGPHTVFKVSATEAMMPNAYASISMVQPHGHNENDLPFRMYGVVPIMVEQASSHLALELNAPAEIKPMESFTIQITSRAEESASYTVAVVDEGLLSLTDFKTPRPWDHFFEKLRLAVKTTDNLNQIIGALFPDVDKYISIGGGLAERSKKQNEDSDSKRFKPVALFKGPIVIEPGVTQELSFDMPNYVGEVRVMIVGAGGNSYGHIEESIPVKQPLMILSTLPRVLRPNDSFALPVSVFANDASIKEARISVESTSNIKVMGTQQKSLSFVRPGEKDVTFQLQVGEGIGTDTITVIAVSGTHKTSTQTFMPITAPNPFVTEVQSEIIKSKSKVTFTPEAFGLAGSNRSWLTLSRIPDIQLDRRMNYLIRYPYGCIEQTTSAVFPQLFLPYLMDLEPRREARVNEMINAGIKRLASFQTSKGFSYWPGGNTVSGWGTNYAGHFLIEAKALGYHVPDHLWKHWIKSARSSARDIDEKRLREAAYRLFLLALADEPHDGGMNLMRENYEKKMDDLSRKLLAAAFYLAGKKDVAREIDAHRYQFTSERETGGSYGSGLRDMAFSAYLSVKMEDLEGAALLIKDVVDRLQKATWYSTQEVGMSLLAYGTLYRNSDLNSGDASFTIQYGSKAPIQMSLQSSSTSLPMDDYFGQEVTITSQVKSPIFASLFTEGVPLDDRIQTESSHLYLSRQFYDEKGNPTQVATLEQGKAFWMILTVSSPDGKNLDEVALSAMLPAGWEVMNLRVTGEQPPQWVKDMRLSEGDFMDIRDDRVNWFFDLRGNRKQHFGVKINPTFKGTYRFPPISVETMYSPEYYARIRGVEVIVK